MGSETHPPGYRFTPTEEELVSFYLKRSVVKKEIASNVPIITKQIYGVDSSPWKILDYENDPWQPCISAGGFINKKTIYVLTELKPLRIDEDEEDDQERKKKKLKVAFAEKNRFSRTAGCGTWHGEQGPKPVINGKGDVIGSWKMFAFTSKRTNDALRHKTGHWIMYEYTLAGVSLDGISPQSPIDLHVLCVIIRDDSKSLRMEPGPRSLNHHVEEELAPVERVQEAVDNEIVNIKYPIMESREEFVQETVHNNIEDRMEYVTEILNNANFEIPHSGISKEEESDAELLEFWKSIDHDDFWGPKDDFTFDPEILEQPLDYTHDDIPQPRKRKFDEIDENLHGNKKFHGGGNIYS